MKRHALRAGEYLAISPDAIKRDADGFFLMLGPDAPANTKHGTVAVVHIRGALGHYKTDGGDSYEAIVERVQEALDTEPSAVVFRIESPGGVVAGLNETVRKLQGMSKSAGVPFIAVVDEMAASAAYAMACSCSEIYAPPSAITGSVGVISTMVSQSEADKAMGIDFRIITSGARKADGHVHAPITDAAVSAETRRVAELADQFFALAGAARRMVPKKLAALNAAIYLAKDARKVGLIDSVFSFDATVTALAVQAGTPPPAVAPNEGNKTDRRAKPVDKTPKVASASAVSRDKQCHPPSEESKMSVKLSALITKTEGALASESDPRKKLLLNAKLSALQVAKAEMDDDGDEGGDDDGDDEDSKSKKAAVAAKKAKAKAEAAKHRAKAAEHKQKMAESEEEAKKCEEEASGSDEDEDGSEAKKSAEEARAIADSSSAARASTDVLTDRVAQLEKREADAEKRQLIAEALGKRISPAQAKQLAGEPLAYVRKYIEMAPKSLVISTDDDARRVPDGTPNADLGADVLKQIETAIVSANLAGPAAEKMRAALVQSHRERLASANGAGGRY